jgi:uncharacterized protein (DUF1501 family)
MLTRRSFLANGSRSLAAAAFLPPFLDRVATLAREGRLGAGRHGDDTILVVIQMSGGNDGLNTVVPFGINGYREARPNLGVPAGDVLPLTDSVGLHPSMTQVHQRYQAGQVAIVQGVGYPNPNLSHFRSMDIWHTAEPDAFETTGWLASYLASTTIDDGNPTFAASITDGLSRALYGSGVSVPAIAGLQQYQFRTDPQYQNDRAPRLAAADRIHHLDYRGSPLQDHVAQTAINAISSSERVQAAAQAYSSSVDYGNFPLANSLKTVAQLIAGNLGTRIYYVAFGGFDTHSAQAAAHARLLGGFSAAVDAFLTDVAAMGKGPQTLIMGFSEFGRRVRENGSQGTDHGTAGPMFVIGQQVSGGLYGSHPSLTDLDRNGNLLHGIDFRAVYGTALEGWMGADQRAALGSRFEDVGFV